MDSIPSFFSTYWLELFLLVVLAYYAVDGYFRGFLLLGLESVGFLFALAAAALGYRFGAELLLSAFGIPSIFASPIAFLAIWALVDLLWPFAIRRLYKRFPEGWKRARWNRISGSIPGVLNGGLLFSVLLSVLLALPVPGPIKERVGDSAVAKPMLAIASALDRVFKPVLGPLAAHGLNFVTTEPQAGETIDLKFTVHDGTVDAEAEQKMLLLVNEERRKQGLGILKWSNALRDVARKHSQDMFVRGYFAHVDPDGLSPADRAEAADYRYFIIGENLALAPTVPIAHDGLMNSPGHRANILEPNYGKIGIGIIDGGVYGKMFTQMFSD